MPKINKYYIVKEGEIYEPVAMYFRNDYMQEYEECPEGVLDMYIEEMVVKELIVI